MAAGRARRTCERRWHAIAFRGREPIWAVAIYYVHHAAVAKAPCLRIEIVKRTDPGLRRSAASPGGGAHLLLVRTQPHHKRFAARGGQPRLSNSPPGGSRRPCASNAALPVMASLGQPGHCRSPILNGSPLTQRAPPSIRRRLAASGPQPDAAQRSAGRAGVPSPVTADTSGRYGIVLIFQAQRCVR